MRPAVRRATVGLVAFVAVAALLAPLVSSGDADDDRDDRAAATASTSAATDAAGAVVPPTAATAGSSPLCDAYLAFLSASADEVLVAVDELAGSLGVDVDPAVLDALAVVGPDPPAGTTAADFVAALETVRSAVVPSCGARYRAAVVPAASDTAALTTFAEALIQGDRAAAVAVAPADVVALFEPWQAFPADPEVGAPSYTVDGATASIVLAATYSTTCQAVGGVVEGCSFGE